MNRDSGLYAFLVFCGHVLATAAACWLLGPLLGALVYHAGVLLIAMVYVPRATAKAMSLALFSPTHKAEQAAQAAAEEYRNSIKPND
ncbi:MAG: hypothetical protein NZM12_01510 [Steroidobacteraceae bacterium]|nr:hypothetical protein [Steroidobacteraceae bacterium]MDW8259368.1 hypothetical protein [Gammaproteobacteria bacterium]